MPKYRVVQVKSAHGCWTATRFGTISVVRSAQRAWRLPVSTRTRSRDLNCNWKDMALRQADKDNFDTLCRAVRAGDIVLVDCTEIATGRSVSVVAATSRAPRRKKIDIVPLARLFDGNPYEQLCPPGAERLAPAADTIAPDMFEGRSFEDVVTALGNMPQTWYPALLRALVIAAYARDVFQPGGAGRVVAEIEQIGRAHV